MWSIQALPARFLQAALLARLLSDSGQTADPARDSGHRWLQDGLNGLAMVGLIDITQQATGTSAGAVTVHPVIADANRSRLLTTTQPGLPVIGRAAILVLQAATQQLTSTHPAD